MAEKKPEGCVQPAGGPIAKSEKPAISEASNQEKGGEQMSVMVGKEAPDFEASAFHEGGFKNIKLSSFRGQWVFLCFYPGDFTFV